MADGPLLFFGAKWFLPRGLRDLQGISSENAEYVGNLLCGIPVESISTPDWRLRLAVSSSDVVRSSTISGAAAIDRFMTAVDERP